MFQESFTLFHVRYADDITEGCEASVAKKTARSVHPFRQSTD